MTKLFLLAPEVAGGLGPQTIITNYEDLDSGKAQIPIISSLEYVFDDWLGDDLLESTPCFVVTERLANKIQSSHLAGYSLTDVLVSKSELFMQMTEMRLHLPPFRRLLVQGFVEYDESLKVLNWSGEDFCIDERANLIVTQKCLDIIKEFNIANCDITELHN